MTPTGIEEPGEHRWPVEASHAQPVDGPVQPYQCVVALVYSARSKHCGPLRSEARLSEERHICFGHVVGPQSELQCIPAQCCNATRQRLERTGDDRLLKRRVAGLSSERHAVVHHSVMTVVGGRDRDGDRLTL